MKTEAPKGLPPPDFRNNAGAKPKPGCPNVTVLMTVYNGMPYLPMAIESVLSQTFTDVEFLIIDDGSTDDSVACLRSYHDARIRLVCTGRNVGQARSLNQGLGLCRGRYIARMDQDDVCLPDRLRQQVSLLEHRPEVAVVGTWMCIIGPRGERTEVLGMRVDDYGAFLGALLTLASPVGHSSVMFRRDTVQSLGGYDESFAPCEDYALWCELARRRFCAATIPHPLMMVRRHAQQQSQRRFGLQQQQARRAHARLVAVLCPGESALVAPLLRMEPEFWQVCGSSRAVRDTLQAWDRALGTMRHSLQLSPRESANLTHRIRWWFSHGASLAALRHERHHFPLYRYAMRGGVSMARYPATWAYPLLCAISPLLLPSLRRASLNGVARLGRQKYVARLRLHQLFMTRS